MASSSRNRTSSRDSDSNSDWSLINAHIEQAEAEWTRGVSWGEDEGTFIDSRERSERGSTSESGSESDGTGVITPDEDRSENESENIDGENDTSESSSEDSEQSGANSNTASEVHPLYSSRALKNLEGLMNRAIMFDGEDSFGDVVRAYGFVWPEKRRNSVSPASSRSRGRPRRARASVLRQAGCGPASEGDENRSEVRAPPEAISGLSRRSRQAGSALTSVITPVAEGVFTDTLLSREPMTDAKSLRDTHEEYKDLHQRGDRNLRPSRAYRNPPTTLLRQNRLSSGSGSRRPIPDRPAPRPRNGFEAMCSPIIRDLETPSDYFSSARLRHVQQSSPVAFQTQSKLTQRIQSRRDPRRARMQMMQQTRTQLQQSQARARFEAQPHADAVAMEERLAALQLEGLRQRTSQVNSLLGQRCWGPSFTTEEWAERSYPDPFLGASSHQARESRHTVSCGAINQMKINSSRGLASALRDYHNCMAEYHRQRRDDIVPPLRPNTPNPDSQISLVEQKYGPRAGKSLYRQQERIPAESHREFGADFGPVNMDQGQGLSNNTRVGTNDRDFCVDIEEEYRQMTRDLSHVWEREEVDTTHTSLNAHLSIGFFTKPSPTHLKGDSVISPLPAAAGHSYWAPLPSGFNATHESRPLASYTSRYNQAPLSFIGSPAFSPPLASAIKTHPGGSRWLPLSSSTSMNATNPGNLYYSQSYSTVPYRPTTTYSPWAPLSWDSNDMSALTPRPLQPMNAALAEIEGLDLPPPGMNNSNIDAASWSPNPNFGLGINVDDENYALSEEEINSMHSIQTRNPRQSRIQRLNSAFGNQIEMLDTLLAGWSRNVKAEDAWDEDEDSSLGPWSSYM